MSRYTGCRAENLAQPATIQVRGEGVMNSVSFKAYDADRYIAEIYDKTETQTEDVALLRLLLRGRGRLRILEPFCGNGRILIPLAEDGHQLVGLDKSAPMLGSAKEKIRQLLQDVQDRITLTQADVTKAPWPEGFDAVILGANCFYELATGEEQEGCIRKAAASLRQGGHLYLDNNHMEGDLAEGWRKPGINENRFPTGTCADGTRVTGTAETIWFDAPDRLVRFRRTLEIVTPDGKATKKEWIEQKHPPSTGEMRAWLDQYSFVIENLWGDRRQGRYTDQSGRAIFWAELKS